ncbi:MAG: ATP-dependent RecD-like DNA helicase [Synergistaceae bacterium]|nr:ATP-dependent RecD-like DNA helicase [Synergistaceae bacterium]
MEKLKCVIERIVYYNEINGYSVLSCSVGIYDDVVTAVGILPDVQEGGNFIFYGEWKVDPKYGRQFYFERYEETLPATLHGIEKFLSGLIKGLGPSYAEKIVEKFGKATLDILDKAPDELLKIPGIGKKRLEQIKKSWEEKKEIRNMMLFLQAHDVTIGIATKIFKQYGNESVKVVKANPYRLSDELWGVGFKTADEIAKKLGFGHERYERIRSGILYTLGKFSDDGHCFAYTDDLINSSLEILDVSKELAFNALEKMIDDDDVICEASEGDDENLSKAAVYLPLYYYSELGTARRLKKLIDSPRKTYIDMEINSWADVDSGTIRYDETQLEAIESALRNKVLVITGGPGTGKTTTTLGIIRAYKEAGAKILLAAPTGRAAKRMSEVTKMGAKTIHRLLKMKPGEGFQQDDKKPLEGDVLIVDECSMIDIILMNSLLKAVPDNMTVILVGDVDQLPSVGAGKVLSDIIESDAVPVIRLEKIFRQAQMSRIVTNAHKINRGEMPYLPQNNSDFLFVPEEETEKAADTIVELCAEILPAQNINPQDIQVLTPMRRGPIGAINLNQRLQAALNPQVTETSVKHFGIAYRVQDKVMQIRNNYDKLVFNGDIGFISEIDPENNEIVVNFDEHLVPYDSTELDELVLAYATTIHKSQGSEFPYVIIPIMTSHYIMLQRNLLYTGVTRAKKGLVIVGERKAIYIAVMNNKIVERNTRLSERLKN